MKSQQLFIAIGFAIIITSFYQVTTVWSTPTTTNIPVLFFNVFLLVHFVMAFKHLLASQKLSYFYLGGLFVAVGINGFMLKMEEASFVSQVLLTATTLTLNYAKASIDEQNWEEDNFVLQEKEDLVEL
ncbi:hypothetical protein [Flectobacillus longus]|uniref:hypothetical protein n=1 Tax=Flectobacillus longus TaxID=2984207 RepID=UPI0024B71382|nr:hypothetical protein [Flectobacillus longus]MDI9882074.1 hypothetical protein [Flectobacillus longus]